MGIRFKAAQVALLLVTALGTNAWAQSGGGHLLRWIVPYAAGGGSDVTARVVAEALKQDIGGSVVVENKPGGGTIIGMQALMSSPADGATVATADSGTLAFNPHLYSKLPYKPESSFSYVGGIGRMPLVLVAGPSLKVTSVADLIAQAKAQPGKFTYASAGVGSPHHIAMELFQQQTGVKLVHVPYRGAAPAVQDVIGGQVDLMMLDMPGGLAHMKAGKVTMLAAAMPARLAQLPDVPTMTEAGVPGFVAFAWQGMLAPAGAPAPVIDRLDAALRTAVGSAKVQAQLAEIGVEPMPMPAGQFRDYTLAEIKRWGEVIRKAGVKLD